MSKILRALVAPAIVSIVGSTAGISPAAAAGTIKAAYVEAVIPSRTYVSNVQLVGLTSFAPVSGVLGFSSITVTNESDSLQRISFYSSKTSEPKCAGSDIEYTPLLENLHVQGNSTLHLPFPTPIPLAAPNSSGFTCIRGVATNGAPTRVLITGVVN